MGYGILVVTVVATVLMWFLTRPDARTAHAPSAPRSPFDEAKRILAARYARGDISPQEYRRMLMILRQ